MSKETGQPEMHSDESVSVNPRRRQVIKGLVTAVPVIMTVSSGHALANASNLQCIPRTEAEVMQISSTGKFPKEAIRRDRSDEWHRSLQWVGNGSSPVQKNVLVYVDEKGMPLSRSAGGMPFTHSCYNSFMPGMM